MLLSDCRHFAFLPRFEGGRGGKLTIGAGVRRPEARRELVGAGPLVPDMVIKFPDILRDLPRRHVGPAQGAKEDYR